MPYLEDVLPELDADAFDPATDIKELFEPGGTQPGGGDTFSLENGEAVLVFLVDWRKARAFTRWCLGFSYADRGSPWRLRRENPQIHPRFPMLTAATVHFSSVAPKSNPDTGVPERAPNYPAVFTGTPATGLVKTGFYDSCYCTVRFVQRPWTFRPDAFVTRPADELFRNCYVTASPTVELLNAEGGVGQVKWAQGGGANQPKVNDSIANMFATRVSKVRYVLNWMWVPEEYLSNDPDLFFPRKLFDAAGRVNSRPFLGRPAGTLLADSPKVERFQFPLATFDGLNPFYGWNISIPLTYFSPRLGVPEVLQIAAAVAGGATPEAAANGVFRGHRTFPWRVDGKWYGAVREDGTSFFLEESDLNTLAEHIGA